MLTVDGNAIDYQETGSGPAVLFVPGSYSTPAAWGGMQKRLAPGYRFIGTSICGYGGTDETRSLGDFDMAPRSSPLSEERGQALRRPPLAARPLPPSEGCARASRDRC